MQKAIEYAVNHKMKYLCFIDECTKNVNLIIYLNKQIQSKIVAEFVCEGQLKGFAENWYFYEPKQNMKDDKSYRKFFLLFRFK